MGSQSVLRRKHHVLGCRGIAPLFRAWLKRRDPFTARASARVNSQECIMKLMSPVVAMSCVLLSSALGAAGLYLFSPDNSHEVPPVAEMLAQPQVAEQVNLYRPHGEFIYASDFTGMVDVKHRHPIELIKPDGGKLDIYLRPDRSWEFTLDYFPAQVGQRAMLKAATLYDESGAKKGEQVFDANGIRHLRGVRLPNGNYQSTVYYKNGVDAQSLAEVGVGYNVYDTTPALLTETRWHENRVIASTSVLNKDNSRTTITYDAAGVQIGVANLSPGISGSTVELFYDGGKQLRLRSHSDYYATHIESFRKDGTLNLTANLTDGILEVIYYDASGKKKTLGQSWFFTRSEKDGVAYMANIRIYSVTEMYPNGEEARSWYWRGTQLGDKLPAGLWSYQEFNTSLAARPGVTCKRIIHLVRDDDPTIWRDDCQGSSSGADFAIEHSAAEKVMPPPVPAAEKILPQLDAVLPIPRPQSGPGGH